MYIVFPSGRLRTFATVSEANSAARAGEILPITRSANHPNQAPITAISIGISRSRRRDKEFAA